MYANSAQVVGYTVYAVVDHAWVETGMTWNNAPAMAAVGSGSSGPVSAGSWTSVVVTDLVQDSMIASGDTLGVGLKTTNTTALSMSSRQGANPPQLVLVTTAATSDTTPPSTPSGVTAAQNAAGSVDVAWNQSTDEVAVDGYTVYRDGSALASVAGEALIYADAAVEPGTTYGYAVDAFDLAGNHSAPSAPVSVTTRSENVTLTFTASSDAYVSSLSPSQKFGTKPTLKVDLDGGLSSYVRFSLPSTAGQLVSATLRVFANSSQSVGYDVYEVANNTWSEADMTYTTAPAMAGSAAGASGRVTLNTWTEVAVTSAVPAAVVNSGGEVSLGLKTTSNTALSLSSCEGANPPQLVLVVAP